MRTKLYALSAMLVLGSTALAQDWRRPIRFFAPAPQPVIRLPLSTPVAPLPHYYTPPHVVTPIATHHHHHGVSRRDLERHVEAVIRAHFGACIDDVDVSVDFGDREVEVDVEFRHFVPHAHGHLRHILHSMPELAGLRLDLEVDFD